MTTLLWLRRDLRLNDHPALFAAAHDGPVVPVFVRDSALSGANGPRRDRLEASLAEFDASTDGALVVRSGDPADVLTALATEVGAEVVHATAEFTPYGRRRDAQVRERLTAAGTRLVTHSSPYAVAPGSVLNRSGRPYRVFTPYARAWRLASGERPAPRPSVRWLPRDTEPIDPAAVGRGRSFGPVGEAGALARWYDFLSSGLAEYEQMRDRPGPDATSRLSVHLKFGEIHPRTLLADLATLAPDTPGADRFITELAWREFYADVLWHRPDSSWNDLSPALAAMPYDSGADTDTVVEAWRQGRTGFPFVDAGMRQLLRTGFMHNRLRMVTASFLVKDLHVWWPVGARHFLDRLVDADVASNNHGWQWVAGTGTDAAPYFRIFNPVAQGRRFDPDGEYVRRWIAELAHLPGSAVHEPWRHPEGYAAGYPGRIVDHDEERRDSLARYRATRS